MGLYVGLMSGTSLDGVDAVLADFDDRETRLVEVHCHVHRPMPADLRAGLLALNRRGDDELHRAALAANALVGLYADAVSAALAAAGRAPAQVRALGAHGQTVRHRPGEFDGTGYTLQLLNGALLAERTCIATVCDFRNADLAAGGQGAPLVPAFHALCFARPGRTIAVLNIGGIANLTLLPAAGSVTGFDCGPGNVLMDLWAERHLGRRHDEGGGWAASGRPVPALLDELMAEPFLAVAPPKSTGRDLFDGAWLDARLAAHPTVTAGDAMATLAEFTARAAADALRRHAPDCSELLVCGGGAANRHLMQRLAAAVAPVRARSSDEAGLPHDQVEAVAFAWLAARRLAGLPGNLPAVTGARGARILGALYPAGGMPA